MCERVAEPEDWPTHPGYGFRRCPSCLAEGLGSVIPVMLGPGQSANWRAGKTWRLSGVD